MKRVAARQLTLIQDAFQEYVEDVATQQFPGDEHTFHIKKDQLDAVIKRNSEIN